MIDIKTIEHGEKFEQISMEILPLIRKMENVLVKHGVSCMARLAIDASDGYFNFTTHDTDWEMTRSDSGSPAKLRHSYSEELVLNEKKEE